MAGMKDQVWREYDDKYWWSGEGLRLHYRDYAADAAHADQARACSACPD
jgi:hypothetical protein